MNVLYQISIRLFAFLVPVTQFFSKKMKLFVKGREQTFELLQQKIQKGQSYIWIHTASLGEFEQGVPLIEAWKKKNPNHQVVWTFFSPSGYEIRKNHHLADIAVYLPLDIPGNVRRYLDCVQPEKVFFVKYEFWPNYLKELQKRKIPTYLISGIFREDQLFFKWYGGFYRKILSAFTHFFVQNSQSKELLNSIGKQNVTIHGDTRFDRVLSFAKQVESKAEIEQFIDGKKVIVVGSSWIDDEEQYLPYLNASKNVKWIIAPHDIKEDKIAKLQQAIQLKSIRYTERLGVDLKDFQVLIIDTIGQLFSIYPYATVSYVGGGFKTGLHNILETAVFGTPIVIGSNYSKFQEAKDLVALGGCISVENAEQMHKVFDELLNDKNKRHAIEKINLEYVAKNRHATQKVMEYFTV